VCLDLAAARANIDAVHPGMPVLELSNRTGQGMEAWLSRIEAQLAEVPTRKA
jgi:hydrogenase nickel incorporation protein HypB